MVEYLLKLIDLNSNETQHVLLPIKRIAGFPCVIKMIIEMPTEHSNFVNLSEVTIRLDMKGTTTRRYMFHNHNMMTIDDIYNSSLFERIDLDVPTDVPDGFYSRKANLRNTVSLILVNLLDILTEIMDYEWDHFRNVLVESTSIECAGIESFVEVFGLHSICTNHALNNCSSCDRLCSIRCKNKGCRKFHCMTCIKDFGHCTDCQNEYFEVLSPSMASLSR